MSGSERDYVVGMVGYDKQRVVRAASAEEAREKVRLFSGERIEYVRERGNDRRERYSEVPD